MRFLTPSFYSPKCLTLALAGSFAALCCAPAAIGAPIPLNFSYQTSAYTLSGQMEGTLQSNGDTVLISAISDIQINGAPALDLPFLTTFEQFQGLPNYLPTVSFSGSSVNFMSCESSACVDGFLIDATGAVIPFGFFGSGASFGNLAEPYNTWDWSLSIAEEKVAEPATLTVLGFGLLALAALRRRRGYRHSTPH